MRVFEESELILNEQKRIYHLNLHPDHIADNIIIAGDPGRIETISKYFDKVELKIQNRELVTHTGYFKGKRITALSTGMGPDNIDIVLNELDALANIDFETRKEKDKLRSLNIIRIGTSGSLQKEIPVDSFVASAYGLGIDGVLNFYADLKNVIDTSMTQKFIHDTAWPAELAKPYIVEASEDLLKKISFDMQKGITATAPGFFGPQGRELRGKLMFPDLNTKLSGFQYNNIKITNFEMETSALYGLGKILGHNTLTVCLIIANRITRQFSKNYKSMMEKLITTVLDRMTS